MRIKIIDIPPEGLTLELSQTLDLFDQGTASTMFTSVLTLTPAEEAVLHVSGRVQSDPQLECSRCLKQFPFRVDTELNIDLAPANSIDREPEHELGRGELDMEFYEGDEVDPVAIIKEQVLLSLPMVPLHSAGCKGLCTACGADLNVTECGCRKGAWEEDKAFSVLKDLFKKEKE